MPAQFFVAPLQTARGLPLT